MSPIVVVDYDPAWPAIFERLRATIWPVVSDVALTIEHVGSTSVPGLAAKPIIDLSVVVPTDADVPVAIERLASLGYVHIGNLGVESREAFSNPDGLRSHHLYLCPRDGLGIANHLAVRDYLRTHPEVATEYGELKKQLAKAFPDDIDSYVDGKTDFLLKILRQGTLSADQLESIELANGRKAKLVATVTGISDHIGWAELVTLTVRDRVPVILDRRRVELVEPGLPSAPYHHEGLALPLEEAELVIRKTRASVVEHCRRVMDALKSTWGVDAIVIQESPYKELPESVARVLDSRPLTYAADGMLYRDELASQACAIGLVVHRFPRRSDQIVAASKVLGASVSEVATILAGFGKSVGAPWRKEHQQVAAGALCILAGSNRGAMK